MAEKLHFSLVSPERELFSGLVDQVDAPGSEGDFGVLPGHTPLFAILRTGQMWYRKGAAKHFLAVSVGFVEVLPDKVTVLSQVAERAEDLDESRALAGMNRAAAMQGEHLSNLDFETARVALMRTIQQLQAESRRRG